MDDDRYFGRKYDGKFIVYARNSFDAIAFLRHNWPLVAEIWCDHDLGGDDTVLPVLDFVREKVSTNEWPAQDVFWLVRIQTDNPRGRQDVANWADRMGFEIKRTMPSVQRYVSHST